MSSPKQPGPLDRARAALRTSKLSHLLAGLLAAVLAAGVTLSFDDQHHVVVHVGGKVAGVAAPTPHTTTTQLGGPGKSTVTLDPAAQAVASGQAADQVAGDAKDAHAQLRAEPAASKSPAVVAHDKTIAPAGQPTSSAHIPQAAVSVPGCRTLHVRNYSSRTGSPTLLFVEHQTISPDNGWSGVLGNVRWFDSPAAQASSNFIISRAGGQCAYIVPMAYKAWAQAGFNSVAVSVEVTENGSEGSYLTGAGRARMIQLERLAHRVYGIPYRHGRVSGCSVVRSGFVEHADLGSCGGGHHDDTPYSIDPLIRDAARADHPKPTATQLLRAKHQRTHQRLAKNHCRRGQGGYCAVLRQRNAEVHALAKRRHVSLAGTYK